MTVLSDQEILDEMDQGRLWISPFERKRLNPASVDLTLGDTILVPWEGYDLGPLDPMRFGTYTTEKQIPPKAGYVLDPGSFILGVTRELVGVSPGHVARLEGKSSLGRLGILVHVTAGFLDPGFAGTVTLEIANLLPRPVVLRSGMPIGQVAFERLGQRATAPYNGHYTDQVGKPIASRYVMD